MRLRHLLEEENTEELTNTPTDKKIKLRKKLKDMWDVIERFEKSGEIHKDDKDRVETFKDFIQSMVKNDGRV